MRQLINILGTPVDILNTEETLTRIEQFIGERRFHQVATANADFIVRARLDSDLRRILRDADLVTPDGMPLVWASRRLNAPLPERVTGADIVPALAERASRKGYRLYMLGARPEVAQRAKARLESEFPGVSIVGCVSPPVAPLDQMDHDALLSAIADARPDILLVAFGNPKQEKWISMHRNRLDVPVCIGVGGTFDFLAGELSRAPDWMKRSGLEWFYRLTQEPRRLWKRYSHDLLYFARGFAAQQWAIRSIKQSASGQIAVSCEPEATILGVSGALDASCVPELQAQAQQAFERGASLIIDLSAATFVDSVAMGTLLNLPKWAAYVERGVRLADVPPHIRRILQAAQGEERLPIFGTVAEALENTGATFPATLAPFALDSQPAPSPH